MRQGDRIYPVRAHRARLHAPGVLEGTQGVYRLAAHSADLAETRFTNGVPAQGH
ncbi:hypothetical protein [Streptomyces venezuelae]|uniref:hypothetical protein n=1 Tax=Streptomyces venezuelae TaxID=54571 RepID=UPI001CC224CA|nr:hypothetical protein [Streptomyces venezuelae]